MKLGSAIAGTHLQMVLGAGEGPLHGPLQHACAVGAGHGVLQQALLHQAKLHHGAQLPRKRCRSNMVTRIQAIYYYYKKKDSLKSFFFK